MEDGTMALPEYMEHSMCSGRSRCREYGGGIWRGVSILPPQIFKLFFYLEMCILVHSLALLSVCFCTVIHPGILSQFF